MTLLARVYANQGKLSEAIEISEKAILIDKLNPGYHYLLANILQELGKAEEAEVSLKRALYTDQNFVLAHFALGNLSRQQGRFKEAGKYFKNAMALLDKYRQEEILPESEGMTAGRLREIINMFLKDKSSIRKGYER
jgi:chemotaxis protein methyltransferase CheR